MAGNNRPKSPKERLAAQQARSFIGRHEQQDLFQMSLLRPNDDRAKLIFSISGQGGVGKTTLLKEFRRIAEKHEHICAYVDEGMVTNRVDDVPEAMHRLAEDLEGQGFKFKPFRERYKAYREKKQEIEADPEAPKGLLKEVVRGGAKMGLDLAKSSIPVVGGMIDSDSIASGVGEAVNYGFERFRNKDEERLMRETLEVLTPLFLEGIKQIPEDKTLVLLLDTYEITGAFLDEWVRSLLDERFGELERGVLVCIGGRNPIDKNAWTEWEELVSRSPLEPFTKEEAQQFLASQNIKSEAVIEEIWRLSSGGLPLLVSMMAAAAPTSVDAVVDPCEDAVNRFLKWETDGAKRQLAMDAACARVLNEDIAGVLGEGQFDWLRGSAFVWRDGGQWQYHSVVREQMVRYLRQKSPQRWAEVHGKLATFYQARRQALGLEVGKEAEDEKWRDYSLEWIYHELCSAPQGKLEAGLNGFLLALKQWGEKLSAGLEAAKENHYEKNLANFSSLIAEPQIKEHLKAVAFARRGETYRLMKRHDEALHDLNRAIELDDKYAWAIGVRGITYREMKRYDEALIDFNRAIELNDKYAWAIAQRGQTYRLMKRYDEALTEFNRAIEIEPTAWKFGQRGETYQLMKRYDEALQDYNQAIELEPTAWKFGQRGKTYQVLKRYEEALKDFDLAVELDPKYAWAISNRSKIYALLEQPENALKDLERLISIYESQPEPNNAVVDILVRLGLLQYQLELYDEALQSFRKARHLQPENLYYASNLGYLYLLQGQIDNAQEAIEKAIQEDTLDRA